MEDKDTIETTFQSFYILHKYHNEAVMRGAFYTALTCAMRLCAHDGLSKEMLVAWWKDHNNN